MPIRSTRIIPIDRTTADRRTRSGITRPIQTPRAAAPERPEAVKKAKNIRTVSVAPMFAQAMLNVAAGNSVSSLFDEAMLGPIYEAFYRFD